MKWFFSELHALHNPTIEVWAGKPLPGTEVGSRAQGIAQFLAGDSLFERGEIASFDRNYLEAVHDPALVNWLERAWEECHPLVETTEVFPDTILHPQFTSYGRPSAPTASPLGELGYYCFDTMTPLVQGTYVASRSAVDVGLSALASALQGERVTYGLCRPPGHHASSAMIGGFCFFNNAAVVAHEMTQRLGGPVAIIDVDYHHGNGTQAIFYERSDVYYLSLHADPNRAFPYFSGHASETGEGAGSGWTANFPLPAGCHDELYLDTLGTMVNMAAARDVVGVVVSLGVDSYGLDPLSDFTLTREVYHPAGALVASLGLPTVIVQEGGYDTEDLGRNVLSFLRGAAGYEPLDLSAQRASAPLPQRHT
jgi:acetoin utilization deacetylase AcuC-like enzyme